MSTISVPYRTIYCFFQRNFLIRHLSSELPFFLNRVRGHSRTNCDFEETGEHLLEFRKRIIAVIRKKEISKMKIIGISASARKNKSTHFLLDQCLNEAKRIAELLEKSLEVELIDLAPMKINGCIACGKCKKGVLCSQDDDFQPLIAKLADPEVVGIVMATPVYMGCMSSQAKAFLDVMPSCLKIKSVV